MIIFLSLLKLKEALSNFGAPKRPKTLFENPNCSLGSPKKFKSISAFPFVSIKTFTAYVPFFRSTVLLYKPTLRGYIMFKAII